MPETPKASQSLGLEITSKEILGASLIYKNRKPALSRLLSISLDPKESTDLNVKPLYMNDDQKQFKTLANKSLVVTAISTKDVLIRPLTIQLTKENDIDSVLEFQAEPLLPYPPDEGVIDRITIEKDKESTKLVIVSGKIELIQQHLELWHSINIEPEVVSCVPNALAAFSQIFYKTDSFHIHVNIGMDETSCALINRAGKLIAAQSIRKGVGTWLDAIQKDLPSSAIGPEEELKKLDFSTLSATHCPALYQQFNNFRMEMTKVVYGLRKNASGEEITGILFTGKGAVYQNVPQSVSSNLHLNIGVPTALPEFDKPTEMIQKYAVPIGMALTALPNFKEPINFRQKSLAYPNPWKRIKKPLATYLFLCIGVAAAFIYFGNAYVESQEDSLRNQYLNLLTQMKKPYGDFEKEIRGKGSVEEGASEGREISVMTLSQQDLQKRLRILENEIKATPEMFPLYPNVPKVSDVLAWLYSYPNLLNEGKEAHETNSSIQLDSFSYKMVKRPEQSKKKEPYQAKVEIEFSTQTPRFAREFHDIILAPNDIVDAKGDVKWNAERGKYRASFFLKDKTIYPSTR